MKPVAADALEKAGVFVDLPEEILKLYNTVVCSEWWNRRMIAESREDEAGGRGTDVSGNKCPITQ